MKAFTKAEKPEPNVLYVASSAAQKCIRRSDVTGALNFAKIMWKCDPFRSWQRSWIWLSEDCCRNEEALRCFFSGFTYKDFSTMVPAIRAMASGPKDRSAASLSALIRGEDTPPIYLWNLLKDNPIHKRVIELNKNWFDREYECYDEYNYGDKEWIIEVAERGNRFDREHFIKAIPYFFMADAIPKTEPPPVNECEPLTYYDDYFPLEALDGHTRPGLAAMGAFCKHRGLPELGVTSSFGLKPYLFFTEGWCAINYQQYPCIDFISMWMDQVEKANSVSGYMSGYWKDWVPAYMKEKVIPELLKVREWAIKKLFKADFDRLKLEYHKDFIE
jgi:hypothetical protein